MADTYTPRLKLGEPAFNDLGWNTSLNADLNALDAVNAVGGLVVTTHEQPSASLLVDVAAGPYVSGTGAVSSYGGATSVAVTTATTNYVYLTALGALGVNTTGFPAACVPLATVLAGAVTITSITDARACYMMSGPMYLPLAGGAMIDGANVALGTVTGTQIGTAAGQKVGFLGATPAVQQTGGAKTATGAYGANEEGMLQAAYNALRAFGFLS